MLRATEFELCSYHFHNIFIKFGKFQLLNSSKLDPYKIKSVYLFLLKMLDFRAYTSNLIAVLCRSTHRRCSLRKGVLRNFAKCTGKHLCQSLFSNKAETPLGDCFCLCNSNSITSWNQRKVQSIGRCRKGG